MSRVAKVWVMAVVALGGVGLVYVYPPVGVGLSFVAVFMASGLLAQLNVPVARLGFYVAVAANAASIYVATESPLLAAVALPIAALFQSDFLARTMPALINYAAPAGLLIGLALVGAAWPTGWWGLAVLPHMLIYALFTTNFLRSRSDSALALGRAREKTAVGSKLPAVKLPERDGDGEFSLSDYLGQFVLMVFVRGDWCPVCHVMMRIISKQADVLAKHKVKLVLITPAEGAIDEEFSSRLALKPGMLLDKDSEVAKSLGLLEGQKDGKDVPLPVAILVDPEGIVRHLSRPDDVTAFSNEGKVVSILQAAAAPA